MTSSARGRATAGGSTAAAWIDVPVSSSANSPAKSRQHRELSVSSSRAKTASSTARCSATSSGCPRGSPNGNGTHSARGGLIFSVCSRMRLIATVTSPASSNLRATTPTVWLHSGQVGVSRTTSTPSSTSRPASAGAVSSLIADTSWSAPITE